MVLHFHSFADVSAVNLTYDCGFSLTIKVFKLLFDTVAVFIVWVTDDAG